MGGPVIVLLKIKDAVGAEILQTQELSPDSGLSEEAWSALRTQLEKAVTRVCPRWMVDRRDDLVQTCLMRVMAILEKSEGNRELGASYLSRVAYTTLIDEIRKLKRRAETPLSEEEGEEPRLELDAADPETSSLGHEVGRGIRQCLAGQVEARRLAVTLNLQGYSVPEAARQLSWTVKKTENLVYRGLAALRRCLEKKGLAP